MMLYQKIFVILKKDGGYNMVTSIGQTNSKNELYQLLSQKNVSGVTQGASLEELQNFKLKTSQEGKPFAQFLTENFEKLDTDKSGTLTVSEVNTYFKNQIGIPQIMPEVTNNTIGSVQNARGTKAPDILGGLLGIAKNPQVQNAIGSAINKAATAYGGQIGSKVTSMVGLK